MSDRPRVRLKIEKLVAGGDGLAFLDGRAVFVPLALPGEVVEARLREGRRDYAAAELLGLVESSPDRTLPRCPIYEQCGGCNLQHLSYAGQVAAKGRILAEAFRRNGGLVLEEAAPIRESSPFAYRNRLQLHLDPEGRLGFMRRGADAVVAAPGCPVAVPPADRWIGAAADRPTPGPGAGAGGNFRGVDHDRFLIFGYGDELWVEGEREEAEVCVLGESIRFRLAGFFQSNLAMLELFVRDLLEGLSGASAADLYCGVGLFAHFLASRFARLTCVERDARSLDLARRNVPGGGHEFVARSVEAWLRGGGAARSFDCVLVDPPRSGLSAPVRAYLVQRKPRVLLYVSCDPVTLARDVGELVRSGYRVESLRGYDFYPQTSHLESYARLVPA